MSKSKFGGRRAGIRNPNGRYRWQTGPVAKVNLRHHAQRTRGRQSVIAVR